MRGDCLLESIQIKNVRSLKDTGKVSLPKVTILVGQNSSGKSTFLRVFPLLKQSISKRTDGPILWAGDADDYVDFGSFTETVTNDGSDSMELSFSFPFSYISEPYYWRRASPLSNRKFDVTYSISISHEDGKEFVSSLRVLLNKVVYEFDLRANKDGTYTAYIDNIALHCTQPNTANSATSYKLGDSSSIFEFCLPSLEDQYNYLQKTFYKKDGSLSVNSREQASRYKEIRSMMVVDCASILGEQLCMGMTLNEIINKLGKPSAKKSNRHAESLLPESFNDLEKDILKTISEMNEADLQYAYAVFKTCFFYSCFSQIEKYIDSYFRQVHYIAPLRATAERYYRLRNLAIDEVDYQGKNLSVFLNGLPKARLNSFQQWTQEYFGFKVVVEKLGGHLSVNVVLGEDGKSINLSDTGFGYSQILPIITQLWDLSTRKAVSRRISNLKNSIPLIIAIEQPELHLHPAIQAKLANAFIASIKLAEKNGYNLQILLETHSQTIVNQFGLAIANNTLSPEDVSVILFEKTLGQSQTQVRTSYYDAFGYLQNWPIGFFASGV